jgi:hypothetical protein
MRLCKLHKIVQETPVGKNLGISCKQLMSETFVGPASTRSSSVVTFATLGYGQEMANNGPSGNRSVAGFRKYFIIMQHEMKPGVLNTGPVKADPPKLSALCGNRAEFLKALFTHIK